MELAGFSKDPNLTVWWLLRFAAIVMSSIVCLPFFAVAFNGAGAARHVPDAVDINVAEDSVIALTSGRRPQEIELNAGELIRERGTYGPIGCVTTNERLLAIPRDPFRWFSLPLGPGERSAECRLSYDLVLFSTRERAVVFDRGLARFVTYTYPPGERIHNQRVTAEIAGFVTGERAVGYRGGSGNFNAVTFNAGEIFRDLEVSAGLLSVVTSKRTLLFQGASGQWTEGPLSAAEAGPSY